MQPVVSSFRLGEAGVTVLDSGLLVFDMAAGLGLPEAAWRPRYSAYFTEPLHVPVQHVLVQTPETTLLVDAGSYDLPPDSSMRVPGYTPPPPIPDQLRAVGVDPAQVQHLVITHLHLDHYNGLTEAHDGRLNLCFPNGSVYVGAADWADPQKQALVQTPGTEEYRTLGEVARQGNIRPVEGEMELAPGVAIIPMPGETPGHLGLRVAAGGQVLYVVGDLYHHVVEVEQPVWHVTWADAATMRATRAAFLERVAAENPLVIASHIPGVGRLEEGSDGWRWVEVQP